MDYTELVSATGFTMKTTDTENTLNKGYYSIANLYNNDKLALYIELANKIEGPIKMSDCIVTRVSQTKYQVNQGASAIIFPGNLQVNKSISEAQIIALFGQPNYIKDYGTTKYYTYLSNSTWTTTNNFKISVVNGVIDELALDHRN